MSNILDIPQIQGFQLDILQNDLHIGFTVDIAKRLQKVRWADEAHTLKVFPEAVAPTDTIDVSREYELIALG